MKNARTFKGSGLSTLILYINKIISYLFHEISLAYDFNHFGELKIFEMIFG